MKAALAVLVVIALADHNMDGQLKASEPDHPPMVDDHPPMVDTVNVGDDPDNVNIAEIVRLKEEEEEALVPPLAYVPKPAVVADANPTLNLAPRAAGPAAAAADDVVATNHVITLNARIDPVKKNCDGLRKAETSVRKNYEALKTASGGVGDVVDAAVVATDVPDLPALIAAAVAAATNAATAATAAAAAADAAQPAALATTNAIANANSAAAAAAAAAAAVHAAAADAAEPAAVALVVDVLPDDVVAPLATAAATAAATATTIAVHAANAVLADANAEALAQQQPQVALAATNADAAVPAAAAVAAAATNAAANAVVDAVDAAATNAVAAVVADAIAAAVATTTTATAGDVYAAVADVSTTLKDKIDALNAEKNDLSDKIDALAAAAGRLPDVGDRLVVVLRECSAFGETLCQDSWDCVEHNAPYYACRPLLALAGGAGCNHDDAEDSEAKCTSKKDDNGDPCVWIGNCATKCSAFGETVCQASWDCVEDNEPYYACRASDGGLRGCANAVHTKAICNRNNGANGESCVWTGNCGVDPTSRHRLINLIIKSIASEAKRVDLEGKNTALTAKNVEMKQHKEAAERSFENLILWGN